LRIVCSKGTYIRTLCADIGEALGVGGHLLTLERRRVGSLTIDRALGIEEIRSRLACGGLSEALVSLDAALESLPVVVVDEETAIRVMHGVPIPLTAVRQQDAAEVMSHRPVRVKDPAGRLLAVGRIPAGVADQAVSGSERIAILKVLTD
jgi:tRNA pseudouridine55 synthase